MRRAILIAAAVVTVAAAVVLLLPAVVDWNAHKPEIAERLSQALGRDVAIAGDLKLSLVPRPELTAQRISIGPPRDGVAVDLAALESLRLRLAFMPLLRGRAHVEEMMLVAPVVRVALPREETAPKPPGPPGAATAPHGGDGVRLDRLLVKDGTLILRRDDATLAELTGVDGQLSSGGGAGPFRAEGSFSWRGTRASLTAATGDLSAASAPLSVVVRAAEPAVEVKLSGQVEGGGERRFRGKVSVSGADLAAASRRFAASQMPPAAAGPFALEAQVKADRAGLALDEASLRAGDTQAKGAATLAMEARRAAVTLTLTSLDLDRWLARPPTGPAQQGAPPSTAPAQRPDFVLPADWDVALDLGAEAIVHRGAIVRQARFEGGLNGGVLQVRRAAAQLPGASQLSLAGQVRATEGRPLADLGFEVASDNLRALLDWLGIDVAKVPADRLRLFAATGKAIGNLDELQLRDLDVSFDRSRLAGALTLRPGERIALGANLTVDNLNLDSYLPPPPAPAAAASPAPAPQQQPAKSRPPLAELFAAFDANLRARVDQLTLNEVTVRSLAVEGTLFDGGLTLRKASFGDAAGTAGLVSGTIAGIGRDDLAVRDVNFELRSGEPAKVFQLLDWKPPVAVERLGSLAFTGTVDGDADGLIVEARGEAGGAVVTVVGAVRTSAKVPAYDLAIEASHASFADLVRVFAPDYRPAGRLGAFAGSLKLEGPEHELTLSDIRARLGPVNVAGEGRIVTAGGKPRFEASLQTGEVDLDAFLPGQRAAAAEPAVSPVAYTPGGSRAEWSSEPLDLGWLNAWDAAVTVNSQAVTWHGFRVDEAALSAGIADGVLGIHRFAGPMAGGSLELYAHLTQGSAALLFEIADANLRNAVIKVAGVQVAGGRLNAGARLESEGRSRFEMASRLRGEGHLDSRDGAVRGFNLGAVSQRLGSIDRIEDVLGLLQLTMGSTGGSTPYSSLTGSFRAADGIAATDDLRMEAEGGTAQGVATVNLPAYTVDGRFVFRLTEQPRAPAFVMLVQGPLDSPRRSFDAAELQSWLVGKLGGKAGKIVEEALTGGDRGNLGGVLKSLRRELGR